jgi:hypothetical protein
LQTWSEDVIFAWLNQRYSPYYHCLCQRPSSTQRNVTFHYDGITSIVLVDSAEDPVRAPVANEVISVGTTYTLRWKPTRTTDITFDLARGAADEFTRVDLARNADTYVGDNLPNTGTASWDVSTNGLGITISCW